MKCSTRSIVAPWNPTAQSAPPASLSGQARSFFLPFSLDLEQSIVQRKVRHLDCHSFESNRRIVREPSTRIIHSSSIMLDGGGKPRGEGMAGKREWSKGRERDCQFVNISN